MYILSTVLVSSAGKYENWLVPFLAYLPRWSMLYVSFCQSSEEACLPGLWSDCFRFPDLQWLFFLDKPMSSHGIVCTILKNIRIQKLLLNTRIGFLHFADSFDHVSFWNLFEIGRTCFIRSFSVHSLVNFIKDSQEAVFIEGAW